MTFAPFAFGNRKLYHPNNAQLGMAIMRAGVTHWHAGQIEEGHSLICQAYRILMVTHGSNHAITKDLEVTMHSHVWSLSAIINCKFIDFTVFALGDAHTDRAGAEDVQAEQGCVPNHEGRSTEALNTRNLHR